jgi:sporulation protein YlmC with PRC-barrel domain
LERVSPLTNVNVTQNQTFIVRVNATCVNGDCGLVNVTLDPTQTSYNFTTCGATGVNGPSLANCNTNYSGTNLAGTVGVVNGIQNWTVPATGTYTIEVAGAKGGCTNGGKGSKMVGTFSLVAGSVLQIAVGQAGGCISYGGGGGGTFVANGTNYTNSTPLIVAGGGGGDSSSSALGANGTTTINGTNGQGCTNAGTNGNGGGVGCSSYAGGGGGGFNGSGGTSSYAYGGTAFKSGGAGGASRHSMGDGGFGGGGGNGWYGGGGGGGSILKKECEKNEDCKEGNSCFENKCVKLFDAEILFIPELIENYSFNLSYLVKGMAEINSDVIIKFWIQNDTKKIDLGKDTIYLGSFEEKRKETRLNLPLEIINGSYDLYMSVGFENYIAESFRKINVMISKKTMEKEKARLQIVQKKERKEINLDYLKNYSFLIPLFMIIFASLYFGNKIRKSDINFSERISQNLISSSIRGIGIMSEIIDKIKLRKIQREIYNTSSSEEIKEIQNVDSFKVDNYENFVPKVQERKLNIPGEVSLEGMEGMPVYSFGGNKIGIIEEVILEDYKIYGWLVKPDKRFNMKKNILIKHRDVHAIKDVLIVDKRIEEWLKGFEG